MRLKTAGIDPMFQHTAARRRLLSKQALAVLAVMFQHTAARRRLPTFDAQKIILRSVSTHSRAEAAA